MNEEVWWFLARSAGIVALVALVASMVWGILLSTRLFRPHDRPAWLLEMHSYLGVLALLGTGLHLAGLALDGYVHFGVTELFVPGASPYRPVAVGIGVVTMYLMLVVQVSAALRRRLPKRVWRGVHYASYPMIWGGLLHAGMAGTDTINRLYQGLALSLVAVVVGAVTIRILTPARRRTAVERLPSSR